MNRDTASTQYRHNATFVFDKDMTLTCLPGLQVVAGNPHGTQTDTCVSDIYRTTSMANTAQTRDEERQQPEVLSSRLLRARQDMDVSGTADMDPPGSPIDNLAAELLAYIIQIAAEDEVLDAAVLAGTRVLRHLILGQVSARWRLVSLSIPRYRRVSVVLNIPATEGWTVLVQRWPSKLRAFMAWRGDESIDLRVRCFPMRPRPLWDSVQPIMQVFYSHAFLWRWVAFDFGIMTSVPYRFHAPRLERLIVHHSCVTKPFAVCGAPLTCLSIQDVIWPTRNVQVDWSLLTTLNMFYVCLTLDTRTLFTITSAASRLVELSCVVRVSDFELNHTSSVLLPNLRFLRLGDCDFNWFLTGTFFYFQAPKLQELEIVWLSSSPAGRTSNMSDRFIQLTNYIRQWPLQVARLFHLHDIDQMHCSDFHAYSGTLFSLVHPDQVPHGQQRTRSSTQRLSVAQLRRLRMIRNIPSTIWANSPTSTVFDQFHKYWPFEHHDEDPGLCHRRYLSDDNFLRWLQDLCSFVDDLKSYLDIQVVVGLIPF